MEKTLYEFFVIKATNKTTGLIRYVKINICDNTINLVEHNTDATIFNTKSDIEQAIEKYCESQAINAFTISSIFMSLTEFVE